MAKAGNRNSKVDLIHKIGALLTGIKIENHVRIICNIDVRPMIAIKYSTCIAVNRFSQPKRKCKEEYAHRPRIPHESDITAGRFCSHC